MRRFIVTLLLCLGFMACGVVNQPQQHALADTLKLLSIGQSNGQGALSGGPSLGLADNCTFWNNDPDAGSGNGTAYDAPDDGENPFRADGSNNATRWLCYHASQSGLWDDVETVLVAKGGQKIEDFDKSSGAMYAKLQAVETASSHGAVDAVIFDQGESDQGSWGMTPIATYKQAVLDLRSNLISDGYMKSTAPFIVTGLCKVAAADIDAALQDLAANNAGIYYVPVDGLPCEDPHFTGVGYAQLGFDRYWVALVSALGISPAYAADRWLITEEQPANTDFGSASAGKNLRHLNEQKISASWATWDATNYKLVFNTAGTYQFRAGSVSYRTGRTQTLVCEITANPDICKGGLMGYAAASGPSGTVYNAGVSEAEQTFTVNVGDEFQVFTNAEAARSGNGLGVSSGSGVNGQGAYLEVEKLN